MKRVAIGVLLVATPASADDHDGWVEVAGIAAVPALASYVGLGAGAGGEVQVGVADACGRTLGLAAHYALHATDTDAAHIGGVAVERRWVRVNRAEVVNEYLALRLGGIYAQRHADHAWGAAPGIGVGVLSTGDRVVLDAAIGALLVAGGAGVNGYGSSYADVVVVARVGVVLR